MFTHRITLGLAFMVCASGVLAQSASSLEELRSQIARAMPPVIGKNNSELASKLMNIQPGAPISRNFDPSKVSRLVFGRATPSRAPDCSATKTASGELDDSVCNISTGKADDLTGPYALLSFSKNIGYGDIKFIKRPAFNPDGTNPPPSVKKTDSQVYDEALKFLESLGVPLSEIPKAPEGAKNPFPVRSLSAGATDGKAENGLLIPAIQKVVDIPRAFEVPGGLYTDPNSGVTLRHVVAPGSALVVIDDTGVQAAMVKGWADVQMDKRLNPQRAKTDQELIDEIAEDLYSEGVRKVSTLSILIGLRNGYPNPEDPDSPTCPVCVLQPSIKVMVSHVDRDAFRPTEGQPFAAPGVIKEYDLIHASEELTSR
jgi:hypothetical protein